MHRLNASPEPEREPSFEQLVQEYRVKQAEILAELRYALDEAGRPLKGFRASQAR